MFEKTMVNFFKYQFSIIWMSFYEQWKTKYIDYSANSNMNFINQLKTGITVSMTAPSYLPLSPIPNQKSEEKNQKSSL